MEIFGFKSSSGIQMSRPIKMLACGTRECALDTCGQIRTREPFMTSQVMSRASFMKCGIFWPIKYEVRSEVIFWAGAAVSANNELWDRAVYDRMVQP